MENTELLNSTEDVVENTEMVSDTEVGDTGTEMLETEFADTEIESAAPGDGEQGSDSSTSIPLEDIESVMSDVLTEYFATAPVQAVIVDSDNGGINKPVEEFTLVEICLVIIVLILIGRAILDIIGGKAWNK